MWGTDDDAAQTASETIKDTRTKAQRQWDDRSYAVAEISAKLRTLTSGTQRMSWSRNPAILRAVEAMLSDAVREVRSLSIEGFREGDPAPAMPRLEPITARVKASKAGDLEEVG